MENQDLKNNYRKVYYAENKSKILGRMSEIVKCQHCEKNVSRQHLNRHMKTKYCQLVQNPAPMKINELDELKNKLIELENKLIKINGL
jgi:hypothetical protein